MKDRVRNKTRSINTILILLLLFNSLFSQDFDDVCLGHLFTYRDFQGKPIKTLADYL